MADPHQRLARYKRFQTDANQLFWCESVKHNCNLVLYLLTTSALLTSSVCGLESVLKIASIYGSATITVPLMSRAIRLLLFVYHLGPGLSS